MLSLSELRKLQQFYRGGIFNPLSKITTTSLREFISGLYVFNPRYLSFSLSKIHNTQTSSISKIHNVSINNLSKIHAVNL